jgi:hypothetical protein
MLTILNWLLMLARRFSHRQTVAYGSGGGDRIVNVLVEAMLMASERHHVDRPKHLQRRKRQWELIFAASDDDVRRRENRDRR